MTRRKLLSQLAKIFDPLGSRPPRAITTPRAELLAALLLARMVVKFLNATELKFESVHLWSDSKIVLAWVKKTPELLQTYVSNRVSEIQQLSQSFHWHYISTHDNPADLISRGVTPRKLIGSTIWWRPQPTQHLIEDEDEVEIPDNELPEMRAGVALAMTVPIERFPIFDRLSSYTQIVRSMAYLVRLARFIKSRKREVVKGRLTAKEVRTATLLISMLQHFWKRWTAEYLPELQNRSKWLKRKVIKVGSLVLLADQNAPLLQWPLARIVAAHPGDDGTIRVVTVKTANGAEFKRAVTEVCFLPLDEDEN
uniref:DUF5641 domain-containing protein n=1 Tax=Anopheles quadriannulatus TaxID=34691 RepID=A0A182WXR6_ANOQN